MKNEEKRESFDVSFKHLSTSPLFFARVVISSFSACVLIAVSMASSRTSCCQICQKPEAFFTCQNCRGDFCEDHINAHQEPASPHREDVLREHQEVQAMIDAYRMPSAQHPLLVEINRWERQSIEKIQQTASEVRLQLANVIDDHLTRIERALEHLKDNERALYQWSNRVDRLRAALISPETIQLREEQGDEDVPFISKLYLDIIEPTDLFERVTGNLRVVDRGQRIVHGHWSDHASVRGKREYSLGHHQLRLKIEQLSSDRWLFLGIASKSAPSNPVSIVTPTAYGFAGQNGLCLNGIYRNDTDQNYESDMEMNDVVELVLDCDQQWIRLTNERTHRSHRLPIDVQQCPFPWQLLVGLCCSVDDAIRILPRTYDDDQLDFFE